MMNIYPKILTVSSLLLAAALFLYPASGAGEGQERTKIAVMNLKAERGLDDGLVKLLNELLLTEFEKTGKYKVIGGSDLQGIMKLEQQKRLMACEDIMCLSEIGGALGVDKLALANIGRIGNFYLVNVKIIDVRKASVEGRVSYKVRGIEDKLIRAITASVTKLVTGKSPPGMTEESEGISASGTAAGVSASLEIERKADPYNLWGHITLWSGVGLAAFGGAAAFLSSSAADDYKGGDLDAEEKSKTWARVMYAGFGVGAALFTTGIVLWLIAPEDGTGAGDTSAAVVPAPDGSGLVFSIGGKW